ncbi:MAG: flagellar basal body P-ring protein FlgI [Sulfurospirillaceae bacterium]
MRSLFLAFVLITTSLYAERIKDIANVIGVRDNQVIGYGLVVGLSGTGDGSSSEFTLQSLSNLLQTVNVKIDPDDIKSKNIAAVIVTAKLPPFARQGDSLDTVVSSIGDAKSLEGGTLLMTPLKGVDGEIYALAQGSISIGGRNVRGSGTPSHATAGTIFEGALVEKEVVYDIYSQLNANLSLKVSDFKTALAIENSINLHFDEKVAVAIDPRTVAMQRPGNISMVEFLAKALDLNIEYEKENRIIIDERTGTVVAGVDILVDPIVITHGAITLKIQPSVAKEEGAIDLKDGVSLNPNESIVSMDKNKTTIANVTRALNRLGATPKEIIAILENIKRAGAVRAKLEVI